MSVGSAVGAATLPFDFTVGVTGGQSSECVAGWEFQLLDTINVSAFGVFYPSNSAVNDHVVTLWKEGRTQVASATVTPSDNPVTSQSGLGVWRFANIPALTLEAGDYRIAASYVANGDDQVAFATLFEAQPIVQVEDPVLASGPPNTFPDLTSSTEAFGLFGSNFRFTPKDVAPIPVPASLPLLTGTLAGLGSVASCKRGKAAKDSRGG